MYHECQREENHSKFLHRDENLRSSGFLCMLFCVKMVLIGTYLVLSIANK